MSRTNATAAPTGPTRPVLTLGTFDGLHGGHVRMLETAATFGPLIVGVNSDRFTATYKAAPVFRQHDRMVTVAALACVHDVVLNDGPGADLIRQVMPRVLAIGPDWLDRNYLTQIGMPGDSLFRLGVTLAFLPPPRETGLASSELPR